MRNLIKLKIIALLLITISFTSCSQEDSIITAPVDTSSDVTGDGNTGNTSNTGGINAGNDPNFTIVANTDTGFTAANRKVVVFGLNVYAYAEVEDAKLLHAANLMAQYLDNNEDGTVDNPALLTALKNNNGHIYLWKTTAQQGGLPLQDLGADESIPTWHTNGHTGTFDAALEEVWHVITHSGYANAYPTIFGEGVGTALTNAMDLARGGNHTIIPNPYPTGSWYTYDDATCNYDCMSTEYIYWAMSSILGAQANRLSEISQEWKPYTNALVQSTDPAIYGLLTDAQYKFPTVLPDGTYRR